MELKVSCRLINNLQPINSNVKLLQCYDIFLTSHDLICMYQSEKLTPTLWWPNTSENAPGNPPHPSPSARWGRDPGITSLYAKTQDCSIFPTPTLMKYHSLLFVALWHRSIFSSIALRNSYYRISIRPPQNILFEPVVEFVLVCILLILHLVSSLM